MTRKRRALLLGGVLLAALGSYPLWRREVAPFVHLARHGDFSPEHAILLRRFLAYDDEARGRFLDEVPHAVELLRSYASTYDEPQINVHDRALAIHALKPRPPYQTISSGTWGVRDLEAEDYDLIATQRGWRHDTGTGPADARLALDYDRAEREILRRPPHAHALLALVQWGVPSRKVLQAIERLPIGDGDKDARDGEMRAFRARLILEDQSIEDPFTAIRRAGLPLPTRLKPESFAPSPPYRSFWRVGPLQGLAPLTQTNLYTATARLDANRKDPSALRVLQRAMRLPSNHHRAVAVDALLRAGDSLATKFIEDELRSENGGRMMYALDSCTSPSTARLLGNLSEHPFLWVRLRAATHLVRMGAAGQSDLERFRDDSARDVRRIAQGRPPLAIATGTTLGVLNYSVERSGSYNPKSATYWTSLYGNLGESD